MADIRALLETWQDKDSLCADWRWRWRVQANPPFTFAVVGKRGGYATKAGATRSAKQAMRRLGFVLDERKGGE